MNQQDMRARIREELASDCEAVDTLNRQVFGGAEEAELVKHLRRRARPLVSLVAETNEGRIVGHILFTPVTLEAHSELQLMGLAPMAVLPEFQRRGIGSEMVRTGLERCKILYHPIFSED